MLLGQVAFQKSHALFFVQSLLILICGRLAIKYAKYHLILVKILSIVFGIQDYGKSNLTWYPKMKLAMGF